MQTFSQYATTRLLLEHPARGRGVGGVALKTGRIQAFTGIDLITGMPVFIYTLPEAIGALPEVEHPAIPVVLETGVQDGVSFVVTASAPGYKPIKPTLSASRLEWLVRGSARALADAHAGGLVHGHLEPSHFLASGEHLLIEGWGLPWDEGHADYRAPENAISAAADVFGWARSMTMFAKGNPRVMLEHQLGRLIGHCLNPRPSERPTAAELVIALEQALRKQEKNPEKTSGKHKTKNKNAPVAQGSEAQSEPAPLVEPEATSAPIPEPETLEPAPAPITAEVIEPTLEPVPETPSEAEIPHQHAPKFQAEPAVFSEPTCRCRTNAKTTSTMTPISMRLEPRFALVSTAPRITRGDPSSHHPIAAHHRA
jgi:hypothetical protein